MTLTFISNYINHHQIPFCNACYRQLSDSFHFIQTQPMEKERIEMGWYTEGENLPYVSCLYEEEEKCRRLITDSDILLAGWSDREDLIKERLKAGKVIIRISERIYREGQWKAISPKGLWHKYQEHTKYRKKQVYLLCAGAYVPSDFQIVRAYPDKMYRWGYFPETIHYTEEEWQNLKSESGRLSIVWAGRFIPLKHPEYMILLAKHLKEMKGLWNGGTPFDDFCIHMAGSGEMETQLKAMAQEEGVEDKLIFHGFMKPEAVRKIMEQSHIHVFSSNHLEGWGAVVNEAMNSGCVVVANVQAGAVPYLIAHDRNGLVYPDNNPDKMIEAVVALAENPQKRKNMSKAAYETITDCWNAEYAAKELIRFADEVLTGKEVPALKGPLSKAPVIAPSEMYQWMLGEGKKGKQKE